MKSLFIVSCISCLFYHIVADSSEPAPVISSTDANVRRGTAVTIQCKPNGENLTDLKAAQIHWIRRDFDGEREFHTFIAFIAYVARVEGRDSSSSTFKLFRNITRIDSSLNVSVQYEGNVPELYFTQTTRDEYETCQSRLKFTEAAYKDSEYETVDSGVTLFIIR